MTSERLCSFLSRRGCWLTPRWSRGLALVALFASLTCVGHSQGAVVDREYAIKAAFLFHLTQFIVWPPEAMPPPGEPIRIGVFQPNPFGNMLEEMVRDEAVDGRQIEVVRLATLEEAEEVQILFIPRHAQRAWRNAITTLANKPILLVSEEAAFVHSGGMIALVREQERVEILINRSALEQAGLSASSRLLRLARTVGDPEPE